MERWRSLNVSLSSGRKGHYIGTQMTSRGTGTAFDAASVDSKGYSTFRNYVLRSFDIHGRLIRTLDEKPGQAGRHEVTWDGRSDSGEAVSTGIYFISLKAGDLQQTRKVLLTR